MTAGSDPDRDLPPHEQLSPSELLRQIAAYSTDSIMVLDDALRIRYISRTVPDLTPEQVIGVNMLDFLRPDQHADILSCIERVRTSGEADRFNTVYEVDGVVMSRWESRVGPIEGDGEITGYVVIASDVSERDGAAAERDRLFDLSLDMFGITDESGVFTRVNPAFVHTLGFSEDELTTTPFVEFVHEDDRQRMRQAIGRVLDGEEEHASFEVRCRDKDDRVKVLEWTVARDPNRPRAYAVARDVTETRAIHDQLRQTQKLDAVGQLAGGIAHDFNNLLQAILGNVHFARAEEPSPEMLGILDQIEAAGDRAAELTRKLLAFSSQQPASIVPIDLNVLARDLLGLLQRVIPENIEIDFVAGHRVDRIEGDRSQIEQVVMNLCLNARDAMPAGGHITIETENVLINGSYLQSHPWAKAGRYVLLSVSDTGSGIAPDVQDRIFEPFFTTKGTAHGAGLGLSTAYGIVQQHDGMIHVYSEPGHGSTFKVYLPVSIRLASDVGSKIDARAAGEAELVLVAEDQPLVRDLVVRVLENAGYQVLVASNGRDAVKLCQAHDEIGVALLDVVMPELSGPETGLELARLRPDMPLVYTSGYSDQSRFATMLPDGAVILSKPYQTAELLDAVQRALDARDGRP